MQIDGVNYHIHTWGTDAPGQPLLCLHGFTGSGADWSQLADALPGQHVIAPDLIGHGRTDTPDDPARVAMDRAAADLITLMERLGAGRFNLLGYSMGARLALYLAVHHPDKISRLVMESGSPGLASEPERAARRAQDAALADRIEREGIPAFVDYWGNLPLFASQKCLPPDVQARVRAGRLFNRAMGLANSLRGMGTGAQPSLWDALPKLNVPTLLITGALDVKFEQIARSMAAIIPDVRHISMPDVGHTPHLEQSHLFVETVVMFSNHVR
jgi:2-succinyl-6-hydroxy-2,4-cyclohexadiene-1-carboxylate synthase